MRAVCEEAVTVDVVGWGSQPDPTALTAQKKALAALEKILTTAIANPQADRPWVMELALAHIYALRGDLGKAKPHAERAIQLHPGRRFYGSTHQYGSNTNGGEAWCRRAMDQSSKRPTTTTRWTRP